MRLALSLVKWLISDLDLRRQTVCELIARSLACAVVSLLASLGKPHDDLSARKEANLVWHAADVLNRSITAHSPWSAAALHLVSTCPTPTKTALRSCVSLTKHPVTAGDPNAIAAVIVPMAIVVTY